MFSFLSFIKKLHGLKFWGLAAMTWPIVYMVNKKYPTKQILFVYITIVFVCLYYTVCTTADEWFDMIAPFIILAVDAILIFVYHKFVKKEQ